MNTLKAAVLFWALVFVSNAAEASTIFYSNPSAFSAAVGGGLSVESFETPFAGGASIAFTGFTMTETLGVNFIGSVVSFGAAAVDGVRLAGFSDNGSSLLTFQFDSPITAFGVFVATNFVTTLTMSVTGDGSTNTEMSVNSPQFFGAFNDSGTFQTIVFDAAGGTGSTNLAFDLVSFGIAQQSAPVPEPTSLFLLCTGLIGAGVWQSGARTRAGPN